MKKTDWVVLAASGVIIAFLFGYYSGFQADSPTPPQFSIPTPTPSPEFVETPIFGPGETVMLSMHLPA
ncbi:MAG: hypothetical protein V1717_04335, partial [Candidatus Micrarchaeota archaeon]